MTSSTAARSRASPRQCPSSAPAPAPPLGVRLALWAALHLHRKRPGHVAPHHCLGCSSAASEAADSSAFGHPGTSSSAASEHAIRSCGWATGRRSAAYPPSSPPAPSSTSTASALSPVPLQWMTPGLLACVFPHCRACPALQVVLTDSGPMLKVDLAATTMLAPMSVLDFVAYKLGENPAELQPSPSPSPQPQH